MCEVVCIYKDKCTSHPQWCGTCTNNTGKRNYYKPDSVPWYPIPWYPWYPYYPTITWHIQETTPSSNYYQGVGQH